MSQAGEKKPGVGRCHVLNEMGGLAGMANAIEHAVNPGDAVPPSLGGNVDLTICGIDPRAHGACFQIERETDRESVGKRF